MTQMQIPRTLVRLLALTFAGLLVTAPALGQECGHYDNGQLRPASDPEPRAECGAQPATAAAVPDVRTPNVPGSLTTLFTSNNGGSAGGGVYFELQNVSAFPITISSWGINTSSTTPVDVAVYSRPGTYVGFETSSAGWILMGTAVGVVPSPVDTETLVPVGGLVLQPGEVHGIAMGGVGGPAWRYTNGTGANQTYNNGSLELRAGSATNVAFAAPLFTPRVWNGVVYYDLAPVELQSFVIQ